MNNLDFSPLNSQVSLLERSKAYSREAKLLGLFTASIWSLIALPTIIGVNARNWLLVLGMVGVAVAVAVAVYRRSGQIIRLRRFAIANDLVFKSDTPYDGRPGLIFEQGHSRKFMELLAFSGSKFLEIGNYRYTTGSGRHKSHHNYGFVHIKLPRRLPHMLLDARKNNLLGGRLSQLPRGFKKEQRISLEGDFDKYFTLYAPAEYKTDALYVFTPDVMQTMIDSVHSYDIEIVDDNCYIFTPGRLALHDRDKLEEMLNITAEFQSQLVDQADYYADARVNDRSKNIIAKPGERLKTGMSTSTKLVLVALVIYILLGLF